MNTKKFRMMSALVAVTIAFTSLALATPAVAAESQEASTISYNEANPKPEAVLNKDNSVTFKNTLYLEPGQKIEYTVITEAGEAITYGVQAELRETRSSSKRTKVYRYTGIENVSFWVTVSNNKITAADSWWLVTVGGSYSDVRLTHNSTEAKLQWTFNAIKGIFSSTSYLRAVVTGRNNDVTTRGT